MRKEKHKQVVPSNHHKHMVPSKKCLGKKPDISFSHILHTQINTSIIYIYFPCARYIATSPLGGLLEGELMLRVRGQDF